MPTPPSQLAQLAAALGARQAEEKAKQLELGADLIRFRGKQDEKQGKLMAQLIQKQEQEEAKAQQAESGQAETPTFTPPQNPTDPTQAVRAGAGGIIDPIGTAGAIDQEVSGGRGVQSQGGAPGEITTTQRREGSRGAFIPGQGPGGRPGFFNLPFEETTTTTAPDVLNARARAEQADRLRSFQRDTFIDFTNILGRENAGIAAQAAAAAARGDTKKVHELLESAPTSKAEGQADRLMEAKIKVQNSLADLHSAGAAKARREAELLGGDPNSFFASDLAGLSSLGPDGKRIKLDPTELRQALKDGRTDLIALHIGSIFDSGKVPIVEDSFVSGDNLRFTRLQDVMSNLSVVAFGEPGSEEHRAARQRLKDTGLFTLNRDGGVDPLQDDSVNSMTALGLERLFLRTRGAGSEVPTGKAAPAEPTPSAVTSDTVDEALGQVDDLLNQFRGGKVPLNLEQRQELIKRRQALVELKKTLQAKERLAEFGTRSEAATAATQSLNSQIDALLQEAGVGDQPTQ
jgi:hypothetical protein